MNLLLSPAAKADLEDIALYIAADNPTGALEFIEELEAACATLGDHPRSGVARPELADGLRSKPYRRYVINYRVLESAVLIERFLHGARDPGFLRD